MGAQLNIRDVRTHLFGQIKPPGKNATTRAYIPDMTNAYVWAIIEIL